MHYHLASAAEFVRRTAAGQPYDPDLLQGVRVQAVIEAAVQAHRQGAWVRVSEVQ